MKNGLFTFLLMLAIPLQAQIYRSVDNEGNIVFTDEPDKHSEKVELNEPTVYSSPESESSITLDKTPPEDEPQQEAAIFVVRIASPANNESIWNNEGRVSVSAIVEPSLNIELGQTLIISVDGNRQEAQGGSTVQFSGLDRGSHTAIASVVDANGSEIATSEPVQFTLHRAHVN